MSPFDRHSTRKCLAQDLACLATLAPHVLDNIDLVHANRKLELMVIWVLFTSGCFCDTPTPPLILYRLTLGPTQSSRCL